MGGGVGGGVGGVVGLMWLLVGVVGGCAHGQANPALTVDRGEAQRELARMAEQPVVLERPVVVLGGIFDPGLAANEMARAVREATGDERVVAASFPWDRDFDAMRVRVLETVSEAFGDENTLPEVDVIAVSMGGLVARYAAMEDEAGERLRIGRLFTLATPHQGAQMAEWPTWSERTRDMRAGSAFLEELDAALAEADYELVPYVRLGDQIVGVENAAPAGEDVYWLENRRGEPAHAMVFRDPRIRADIFRRLRGERALFEQAQSLPGEE